MKKPCIFVQNNYVTRVTAPVAIFARENGIDLVDRSCGADFDPDKLDIDWSAWDPILPVGSVQFMRSVKRSASLSKYILHDEVSFSYPFCVHKLGGEMLNNEGVLLPAARIADLFARGKWHVRPSQVDKAFTASLFDAQTWQAMLEERVLQENLLCWASPPKTILGEWRTWTIDGQVIEISRYRDEIGMRRDLDVPPEVRQYAYKIAPIWQPAPVSVMDIALTADGPRVLEFNPVHGSGHYAARVDVVMKAWLHWATQNQVNLPTPPQVGGAEEIADQAASMHSPVRRP